MSSTEDRSDWFDPRLTVFIIWGIFVILFVCIPSKRIVQRILYAMGCSCCRYEEGVSAAIDQRGWVLCLAVHRPRAFREGRVDGYHTPSSFAIFWRDRCNSWYPLFILFPLILFFSVLKVKNFQCLISCIIYCTRAHSGEILYFFFRIPCQDFIYAVKQSNIFPIRLRHR